MDRERKSMRWGVMLIALAAIVRFLSSGLPGAIIQAVSGEETVAVLLYLESGRVVRPAPEASPSSPQPGGTTPPEPTQPEPTKPLLEKEDSDLVKVRNSTSLTLDVPRLMEQSAFPQLVSDQPTVLIVHTHGSESYLAQAGYTESSPFRTYDENYNMVSIGSALADKLRSHGIGVIHDTKLHDVPDYNGAYASSRASIREYLEEYPSIRLVLDLHRDASNDYVNQLTTAATVSGENSSQLMLVIGGSHEEWEQNIGCAIRLQAVLEKSWPGICRAMDFRTGRFNQDLGPVTMLVEVGAAGDTRQEALIAADALGEAIIALSGG